MLGRRFPAYSTKNYCLLGLLSLCLSLNTTGPCFGLHWALSGLWVKVSVQLAFRDSLTSDLKECASGGIVIVYKRTLAFRSDPPPIN